MRTTELTKILDALAVPAAGKSSLMNAVPGLNALQRDDRGEKNSYDDNTGDTTEI